MTHEELVRFAAGKVGIVVCDKWERFNSHQWMKISGACSHKSCTPAGLWPPDLTSPELFFKGLGVCPYHVSITKDSEAIGRFVFMNAGEGRPFTMKHYDKVDEAPLLFWHCWAELEGGQE